MVRHSKEIQQIIKNHHIIPSFATSDGRMLHPFATPAAEPSTSSSFTTTTNTNGSTISWEPRQYVKYLQRQVLEMKQKPIPRLHPHHH